MKILFLTIFLSPLYLYCQVIEEELKEEIKQNKVHTIKIFQTSNEDTYDNKIGPDIYTFNEEGKIVKKEISSAHYGYSKFIYHYEDGELTNIDTTGFFGIGKGSYETELDTVHVENSSSYIIVNNEKMIVYKSTILVEDSVHCETWFEYNSNHKLVKSIFKQTNSGVEIMNQTVIRVYNTLGLFESVEFFNNNDKLIYRIKYEYTYW